MKQQRTKPVKVARAQGKSRDVYSQSLGCFCLYSVSHPIAACSLHAIYDSRQRPKLHTDIDPPVFQSTEALKILEIT